VKYFIIEGIPSFYEDIANVPIGVLISIDTRASVNASKVG